MEINEILKHFPKGLGKDIERYAIDDVLRHSRYLFTHREGKHQYAYCTHCGVTSRKTHFRTGNKEKCPQCDSECVVRASGVSRKYLYDFRYFVFYEKSTYDPGAIIARGISVERDYRGDYRKVKTKYEVRAYYLFRPGQAYMLQYDGWQRKIVTCKTVFTLHFNNTYSRESIEEAVAGTPFQYSTWEKYAHEDMIRFFSLFAKYPCIEYLTKMGFGGLVKTKLLGQNTYGTIYWRGKSPMKVLRLTKHDLREIKRIGINVDTRFLRILQQSRRDGSNFTMGEALQFDKIHGDPFYDLQTVLKLTNLRRSWAYALKQLPTTDSHKKKVFHSEASVFRYWKDYLGECVTLGLDLTNERILFPKNLYRAHQNTTRQIKHREDELLTQKIVARVKQLQKYCYENMGLIIRPAADQKELIAEGKALEHCVGGYAKAYAEGRSIIMLIRSTEAPDKPFFTMELYKNTATGGMGITQCRGRRNCAPDDAVQKFVDAFTKARLQPEKEVRGRGTVPA